MNLEQVAVKIKPRSAWEAIDLGFHFARKYWPKIFLPWLILILPTVVIITQLLYRWPVISIFVIWWLKPFYDRYLLSMYSRILFNDPRSTEDTLKSIPTLFRTQLIGGLTIHRLWLARSYFLPVLQLEGLRGKQRTARSRILGVGYSSNATWLTIACMFLELLVITTLLGFIYLMLPTEYQATFEDYVFFPEKENLARIMIWNLIYGLSIFVIEPFYVAAGFMLYINRRTHLEGWDIELSFRKINNRINDIVKGGNTLTQCLLAVLLLAMVPGSPGFAAQDEYPEQEIAEQIQPQDQASEVISTIFAREDMGTSETRKYLKYIGETGEKTENADFDFGALTDLFVFFAQAFKAILILIIIFVVAVIILNRDKWLPLLGIGQKQIDNNEPIESLFGMDLRPDSLPDDIGGSARYLVEQKDIRGALSLLYRGALSTLVNNDALAVKQGHTESEILSLAKPSIEKERDLYLNALTTQWILTAYSHHSTATTEALRLCERWPVFGANE